MSDEPVEHFDCDAADAEIAALRKALRLVVNRLTAADGESVACGAGASLGARAIAAAALNETPRRP